MPSKVRIVFFDGAKCLNGAEAFKRLESLFGKYASKASLEGVNLPRWLRARKLYDTAVQARSPERIWNYRIWILRELGNLRKKRSTYFQLLSKHGLIHKRIVFRRAVPDNIGAEENDPAVAFLRPRVIANLRPVAQRLHRQVQPPRIDPQAEAPVINRAQQIPEDYEP